MLVRSIQNKGFAIKLVGDDVIEVAPFSRLTMEQKIFIRDNKNQIIAELKSANDFLPLVGIDAGGAIDDVVTTDSAAEVVTVTTTDRYPSHSGGCYALPSEVRRVSSQPSPAELAELVAKLCTPRSQSA